MSKINKDVIDKLKKDSNIVLLIDTDNAHGMSEQRRLFIELLDSNCKSPVIIGRKYENISNEEFQLYSATDIGGLFVDGLGDGIYLTKKILILWSKEINCHLAFYRLLELEFQKLNIYHALLVEGLYLIFKKPQLLLDLRLNI